MTSPQYLWQTHTVLKMSRRKKISFLCRREGFVYNVALDLQVFLFSAF